MDTIGIFYKKLYQLIPKEWDTCVDIKDGAIVITCSHNGRSVQRKVFHSTVSSLLDINAYVRNILDEMRRKMTDTNIIALSGYRRCGKDTIADYLVDNCDFHKVAFAEPLRRALAEIITTDLVDKSTGERVSGYRKMMMTLGHEWGRKTIDENILVLKLNQTICQLIDDGKTNIVISDVRYQNDDIYSRAIGAKRWHITNKNVDVPLQTLMSKCMHYLHINRIAESDRPLPHNDGDIIIDNSNDLISLYNKINIQMF